MLGARRWRRGSPGADLEFGYLPSGWPGGSRRGVGQGFDDPTHRAGLGRGGRGHGGAGLARGPGGGYGRARHSPMRAADATGKLVDVIGHLRVRVRARIDGGHDCDGRAIGERRW